MLREATQITFVQHNAAVLVPYLKRRGVRSSTPLQLSEFEMYESSKVAPLPTREFAKRLLAHLAAAAVLLIVSLAAGMLGYVALEHLSGIDAFLNASMLLGGMGPVDAPKTFGGKLFAGLYALYAGLVFIVTAALVFTPIAHRILHKFHSDSGL